MGSKAQELTVEEIEKMKQESLSSKEIIDKIIKSHKSFHNKTVYSQEKYVNRKKQKFAKYFTVEYLSSSNLLQFLIDKGDIPKGIGYVSGIDGDAVKSCEHPIRRQLSLYG
ncbi:CBM_collapsed_G0049490.mRNA.1.CDS.1 [Saccharomyces cerevisiae]|nr:CBM_collapsed_G0049490.mRNA.1.CDS.1 [Saccharomyces cerevisiae]